MARIVQTTGIVIRRMNYRESSMIVDIFTESHGLSGFIVSGVRKTKPAFSPVLFTPGYTLSIVFYERDPYQLWRI
ncbi:MAG TPA: recombination protein O N-terminal domain-containing protein, partial [Membranihabitans sp.]|nr:recombination protein O N-terminal domain-containing protein [Membranihabitans sp.]